MLIRLFHFQNNHIPHAISHRRYITNTHHTERERRPGPARLARIAATGIQRGVHRALHHHHRRDRLEDQSASLVHVEKLLVSNKRLLETVLRAEKRLRQKYPLKSPAQFQIRAAFRQPRAFSASGGTHIEHCCNVACARYSRIGASRTKPRLCDIISEPPVRHHNHIFYILFVLEHYSF